MLEGEKVTQKEIHEDGFVYQNDFGIWKVYQKHNSLIYWNPETAIIDRTATYQPRNR